MGTNHEYYLSKKSTNYIAEIEYLRRVKGIIQKKNKNDQIRENCKKSRDYNRVYRTKATWLVGPFWEKKKWRSKDT